MNECKISTQIKPRLDLGDETLTFETHLDGIIQSITKEVVNFKEETTTKALIKLGWTPPPKTCPACKGKGYTQDYVPFSHIGDKESCRYCRGTGTVIGMKHPTLSEENEKLKDLLDEAIDYIEARGNTTAERERLLAHLKGEDSCGVN